jgi:hypothetical protein
MIKVKFNFEDQNKHYDFEYNPKEDFIEKQIRVVSNHILNKDESCFYHLFDLQKNTFIINPAKDLENSKTYQMKNTSKFAVNTVESLQKILDNAQSRENNALTSLESKEVMSICFFLKNRLEVDSFAEEFISYDGLKVLISIIETTTGNSRSYALNSLISLIYFKNANEYIRENPIVVQNLYSILINTQNNLGLNDATNTPTINHILKIFIVLSDYLKDDGIDLILYSAETYSENTGKKPFEEIVDYLTTSEINVKINTLTLINSMIKNTDRKSKQSKITAYFNEAGLIGMLNRDSELKNNEFQNELTIFQKITGEIIHCSSYEVELYKARVLELENHCNVLERKAEFIFLNQKFYSEIVEEFVTFQQMAEAAIEIGGYYDPSKIYIIFFRYSFRKI